MRIIATADIHGKQYRMNEFLDAIDEYSPDIAIICGDITHFGPGEMAKILLDQIPIDTFAVPGNIDTEDVIEYIEKSKATNLHLKKVKWKNITLVGLGGAESPLQFFTKKTDNALKETVLSLVERDCIFVTHVPPYGVVDSAFLGMHAGSRLIREVIEKKEPKLHLCGHIHESPGHDMLFNTVVVNCSCGRRGRGALIDIDGEIEIKMLE